MPQCVLTLKLIGKLVRSSTCTRLPSSSCILIRKHTFFFQVSYLSVTFCVHGKHNHLRATTPCNALVSLHYRFVTWLLRWWERSSKLAIYLSVYLFKHQDSLDDNELSFLCSVFCPYFGFRQPSRKVQPWRRCPLCSRFSASHTSTEASWWAPSSPCRATRSWWRGNSLTVLESPQTGWFWKICEVQKNSRKAVIKWLFVKTNNKQATVQWHKWDSWRPFPSPILLFSLLAFCRLWRDLLLGFSSWWFTQYLVHITQTATS